LFVFLIARICVNVYNIIQVVKGASSDSYLCFSGSLTLLSLNTCVTWCFVWGQ